MEYNVCNKQNIEYRYNRDTILIPTLLCNEI